MSVDPRRKARYDATMGLILRTLTRGHRVLYQVTGGRVGRRFPGGAVVVWITSLGRKSGVWRRNPLLGARDLEYATTHGVSVDRAPWIVAGSNAGQDVTPAWVFNVRAHNEGFLEVDGVHYLARFEEVTDHDERRRVYGLLTKIWSAFRTYEQWAQREIPVFRIHMGEQVSADEVPGLE